MIRMRGHIPISTKPLHTYFQEQVERSPNATAVVFEGLTLTYEELNRRANRLAHFLRGLDVKCESLVAVHMDRSLELIVGLLGILLAIDHRRSVGARATRRPFG